MTQNETDSEIISRTTCGGTIESPEKYPSTIFKGERIFFCTVACLKAYETDPERFMAGEIDHPMDND